MNACLERRAFLSGCLAAATVPAPTHADAGVDVDKRVRLVVGLLSDIHLKDKAEYPGCGPVAKLDKAFRLFDACKADAVLISGDLADNGIVPQLEQLARIWERHFPSDCRSDGERIERLFHFGDHDTGGYAHKASFFKSNERLKSCYGVDDEALEKWAIRSDRAAIWRRVFGEEFAPIQHKRVKGYDFVLAHWDKDAPKSNGGNATPGLGEALLKIHPDPDKPFFYSQHRVYRGCVGGPFAWGQDDGSTAQILSAYPNVVAFCGHGHLTATDESAIWQGAFTAIEIPSLRYVGIEPGHANKINVDAAEQGLLMRVYDQEIVIERYDFSTGERLGPDWRFPIAKTNRPYSPASREAEEIAPQFPSDAWAKIRELERSDVDGRRFEVSFPVVRATSTSPRAYDYEVSAACIETGGRAPRIVKRVFSESCIRSDSVDVKPVRCVFTEKELSMFPRGELVAQICPCGRFGRRGKSLIVRTAI